jgi:hypothetical protein
VDSSSLSPDTARLWLWLKDQPALAGLTLVGGTALALHLRHRISEDLDFVTTHPKLPVSQIAALRRLALESGFSWTENDDPSAIDEFATAGMELRDYQQDYVVNGTVKLTFFTADEALSRLLVDSRDQVASLAVLFDSKAILTASRSRSRDWLDLYLLMSRHGFTSQDYLLAFEKAGIPAHWEYSLNRISSGRLPAHDPGYSHLLASPPSLEEIVAHFSSLRDSIEAEKARKRLSTGTKE